MVRGIYTKCSHCVTGLHLRHFSVGQRKTLLQEVGHVGVHVLRGQAGYAVVLIRVPLKGKQQTPGHSCSRTRHPALTF